jgi:hypothetical protein
MGASDEGWLHQTDTYFRVPHGRLKLCEEGTVAQLISYERSDETVARESRYRLVPVSDPAGLKDALGDALAITPDQIVAFSYSDEFLRSTR